MGSRLESNSNATRKRIENHTFEDEGGEEYEGSKFGGFNDYFRRKKIKLQNLDAELRSQSVGNPNIFRGVVAHINGYTQPSLNDLHKLIVAHGGGFMQYLDGKTTVTHIICSNLTPKKAVEFKRYRIVKPAWVVESVKAGRLLPWDGFRVLAEGAGQRVLGFDKGKVVSHADVKSKGYRDQTENSWYTSQLKADGPSSSPAVKFVSQKPPTPEIDDEIDDVPSSPHQATSSAPDRNGGHELPASPSSSPIRTKLGATLEVQEFGQKRVLDEDHGLAPDELAELADASFASADTHPAEIPFTNDYVADGVESFMVQHDDLTYEIIEPRGGKRLNSGEEHLQDVSAKRSKLTAEEHNAILLADPKIRKSTVVNPEFLEQYYRESRLHHLSTWKAELKAQMQAMAAAKSASQKQRKKRPAGSRRYVLHVDFDSFFAAVSLKKHPQYKDKPAVVAHGNGSGSEIASCNYPARKFGVKNGMWMKRALDLCSDLKIMPYDFPAYEEASRAFYEAIIATGGVVQSVSIDEALVDITDTCLEASGSNGKDRAEGSVDREQAKADQIAQSLRDEVKAKTECNVSVGIGGNILLAKVALRKAKPAGQYHIKPEEILEFVGKLEVQDLPGVAYSIGGKLEEIGIKYVQDIREASREKLISTLGPKTGEKMWEYARGIDRTEVGDVVVRKSVSAEVNWGVRFENQEQVDEFIENLCGEVMKRLLKERVKGRQLTMKIMRRSADAPLDPPKHLGHGKCDTYNKSVVLGVATNAQDTLAKEALSMLKSYGFSPGELRGLGVQMTRLEPMKTDSDGQLQSSQRKLQFNFGNHAPKAPKKDPDDPIQDDVVTPKKPKPHPDDADIGFGASQLNVSTPSRKPLNTYGTQFVLPTQFDPKVLEELPEDIRAKLAKHVDLAKLTASAKAQGPEECVKPSASLLAFPNQSQIDLETFNALPVDVRDEILAFYNYQHSSPSRRKGQDQTVLPQSPRKVRTIAPPKKPIPAPALLRKRGRPSKADVARAVATTSTLTQSNFITSRFARATSHDGATTGTESEAEEQPVTKAEDHDETAGEVAPEILAALPDDIRREVLEEQRRARLKKTSGLDLQPARKKPPPAPRAVGVSAKDAAEQDQGPIERLLRLPPRPAKPTFTMRKLSMLPDLRDAISSWWSEFRSEGPYEEDVDALVVYLDKVVGEEGDMSKAVAVVRWLSWVVEEGLGDVLVGETQAAKGKEGWTRALERTRASVKDAVRARGFGKVDI